MKSMYVHLGGYRTDWGDAPTWAAAIFALIAGIVAYRIYKIESKRDQQAAVERGEQAAQVRRAQAMKVAAWFGSHPQSDTPMVPHRLEHGANVRNSSELPVFDVEVAFQWVASETPTIEVAGNRTRRGDLPVLPPGETVFVPIPREVLAMLGEVTPEQYLVEIEFTDSAGNRWRREGRGDLVLIPSRRA